MSMCKIALVEDDQTLLQGLTRRLASVDGFDVVLAVETCAAYLDAFAKLSIDLLVTDLGLPDGDGTELIRATVAHNPKIDIMVFTVFGDERRVVDAIRSGATGYLLKDDNALEMQEAIIGLRNGEAPISPGIARFLVNALHQPSTPLIEPLTPREKEVLAMAAKGYSNREIAELLEISPHTVASYTKQIYEKLAVNSRNEAIFEATRLGVLK